MATEEPKIEEIKLEEGVIDLSGNGFVTKKILQEGIGEETPQGIDRSCHKLHQLHV